MDLLPVKTLPAATRTRTELTGTRIVEVPDREVPADDGWRAKVELTDESRAILTENVQ